MTKLRDLTPQRDPKGGSCEGWTIDTLKEHLEQRIDAVSALQKKDVDALNEENENRSEQLKLQAGEYERRLTALNGEQSRIAQSQSTYVSREVWERFDREDRLWKSKNDISVATLLPKSEFQTYKETTDRALQLKQGQSAGIGLTTDRLLQMITLLVSLGIGLLIAFSR